MIIEAVRSGPHSIDELAKLTGASSVSVRRDLAELADQGVIRRFRGGAARYLIVGLTIPSPCAKPQALSPNPLWPRPRPSSSNRERASSSTTAPLHSP
ncbi:hypothetical protein JCM18909_3398 [Cutibacterium acnes JCM 18909]|nr:hypothetical protein JCM18909_3398 [Cutibacterium acnes JCM 18909]